MMRRLTQALAVLGRTPWSLGFAVLLASMSLGFPADDPISTLGFQDVYLNQRFSKVPEKYKTDCGRSRVASPQFLFCSFRTEVGTVSMSVEISFRNERVVAIHAYFPAEHFDLVWSALREKYGREKTRSSEKIEWRSNDFDLEQPLPDEIYLRRTPESLVLADGTYFHHGVKYAVIEYHSSWEANESARRKQEERKRKIKGIADNL